jgi:acetyl esterase/lipase
MDLYLPSGRDTVHTKLMILIHGGAWIRGDKADFAPYMGELQRRFPGYAFATLNYRLFNNGANKFPAQENDVKAAMEFLMNKRPEYKYSDQVILLGLSAGAHLALLQGYKYSNIVTPKAIISFFGPTDFTDMYNNPSNEMMPSLLANLIGFTPEQNPSIYKESSPVNFISKKSPPTILLQGKLDPLVSPRQADLLIDKLQTAGVPNQLVIYPNAKHGFKGADFIDSINKIEAFLKQYAG